MAPVDPALLAREALRLHERYAMEIVEAFDICPWARRAREAGEWRRFVLPEPAPDIEPSLHAIRRLEADPAGVPVAILLYPRLALPPRRFDEFANRLRDADAAHHHGSPIYVSATFHPDYPLDHRTPASLVPWLRRSPDPSIQLIRLSVIDEARGGRHGKFMFDFSPESWAELKRRTENPSVTDRITRDNHARVDRETPARLEAIYADILADRARAYAALDLPPGGT
jgi:hypothetical protein